MEKARALIPQSQDLEALWSDVVLTAIQLINKLPTQ